MAAGDDAGGAVLFCEVGDRPHGVADDRDVGTWERDELVVGMDRLCLFVGPDGDGRERGDQEPRIEDAFDDGEHVGVHGDLLEGRPVHEQVVDPRRPQAFEEVLGRNDTEVLFQLEQRLVDLVHQLRLDRVREDGVTVLGDAAQMGFELGEGAGRGPVACARCHDTRCHVSIVRPRPPWHVRNGGGSILAGGRVWVDGPLAQLVAHLHDAQGVRGSSPLRPTRSELGKRLRDPVTFAALPPSSSGRAIGGTPNLA